MPRKLVIIGLAALASLTVMVVPSGAGVPPALHAAKAATRTYRNIDNAVAPGYGELQDADGIACIADPGGAGAMGIHYVNGALVGDAVVDGTRPEALMYQPGPDGSMTLVGMEYVVFKDAWGLRPPPKLFGRRFSLVTAPNRYGLPPFYELHAWLWLDNANGTFADWNPAVSCPG